MKKQGQIAFDIKFKKNKIKSPKFQRNLQFDQIQAISPKSFNFFEKIFGKIISWKIKSKGSLRMQ